MQMIAIIPCFEHAHSGIADEATHLVVNCIRELSSWMIIRKLIFNDDKIVALLLCRPKQRARLDVMHHY